MMAATVGPDIPMDPASTASVAPETRVVSGAEAMDGLDISGPNHHSTPRSTPPPNPPFVFPARPTSASSSAPSSYSRATGRRPKSFAESMHLGTSITSPAVEKRQSRSPALPEFSFNPGARSPALSVPDQGTKITSAGARSPALPDFKFNPGAGLSPPSEHPFLSPPQSPQSPRAAPIRATGLGHRRGGSEFVGGQIRSGDAITVLGTSPTKSESGFASPQLKPANPRRGHAHRRSAALSSHDLSMILKPASPQLRGSSAPSSPAAFDRVENFSFPNTSERLGDPSQEPATPKSEENKKDETPGSETTGREGEENVTPRPPNRARVGFSDTLEFIPRPLSLISSDTSSTVTARPGHSLSGSISSVISLPSSVTAPELEANVAIPSSSRRATDARPSTAGAILERSQSPIAEENKRSPQRRNSIPLLNASALTAPLIPDAPSPSKAPKRWSFFGLEPFVASTSPTRTRPLSSGSADSFPRQRRISSSSDEREGDAKAATDTDEEAPQKRGPSKVGKKKKKVKTWAGSILTRKSKHRQGKKSRRSQTPPPANVEVDDEDSSDGVDEAASVANTPILAVTESPRSTNDDEDPWLPGPPAPEEEVPYPMIDLDAALGPFNTPLARNAEWEAAQRASGLSKRPLHSAARLSGFSGPGMHYQHRRAESAPEMPPFNRAGIPRFNSNSTMADVFEEDEEDDTKGVEEAKAAASSASVRDDVSTKERLSAASIDIRVTDSSHTSASKAVDHPSEDDAVSSSVLSRKGSGLSCLSDDDRTQPSSYVKSEYSASSLHDEIIVEETRDENWRVADCRYPPSGDTSDSATPSPRRAFKGKELAPVDVSPLHLPTPSLAPVSPYSISQSSAFPSPRSPMSYDGNRISTAPSSFTEDNFQSLLMGEPGPEVRISMDIPSLTSSNSTMTRESAFAQTVQQLSQAPVRGERPASFSSPFGRRGSLASIGRLISTSHGERSKLSTEVSLDSEPVKKPKPSKAKRLSRMMQFWKPKDAKGASTT